MRGCLAGIWLCAACGRLAFDDQPAPPVELPAFDAPVPITELNLAGFKDDDPSATGDLLELYFNSDRPGSGLQDIYVTHRARVTDRWDPPQLVGELSTAADETNPEVSSDGLTLYFARQSATTGLDLFVTTRTSRDQAWAPPAPLVDVNTSGDELCATPSPQGDELIVTSDRGGRHFVFFSAGDSSTQRWGVPQPMALEGVDAYLAADGRHLLFHDEDLFVAERGASGLLLGPPTVIPNVESEVPDTDPWTSPDLQVLLFASQRDGDSNLYEAHAAE